MNRKDRRIAQAKGKLLDYNTQRNDTASAQLFAEALNLQQIGKMNEAESLLQKILRTHPNNAAVLNVLGIIQAKKDNIKEGIEYFEKAIASNPNYAKAYNNLGYILHGLKQYDKALINFDKAIALEPDYADAYYNHGVSLYALQRGEEALLSYDRTIALNPCNAKAHLNRGILLFDLKRYEEAVASYDKSIGLEPDFADAYIGKAWIALLHGNYDEGWKLNEWRFKQSDTPTVVRTFGRPIWRGDESLEGKTIMIHAEQGLGDTIQFCRYLPMLAERATNIILIAPEILRNLLLTLKCSFRLVTENQPIPDFDFECPLMSLPLAFRTTINTIPAEIPYLFVDTQKQKIWQQKLGIKNKPRIGLVWSGGTGHKNDHNRTIAIEKFIPLLTYNADFHCLQKEVRETDRAILAASNIICHTNEPQDFADTAALIQEMDLVISVDTSVAHLAGALGKPVWILLPYVPDYRWMLVRDDSPWYPTAKLFRQTVAGNWKDVIEKMRAELKYAIEI